MLALYIRMLSENTSANFLKNEARTEFIKDWNVAGALFNTNGITSLTQMALL